MSTSDNGFLRVPARNFSRDESLRYSRHFVLPSFGETGQRALRDARILIVGAGGLGSPAALYLAAAGIGTIGLVDSDVVDLSNLQRQVLYGTSNVGARKLDAARARILDANPGTNVALHETYLSSANALEIIKEYDIVLDGTDNFPTRYLVNDACVLLHKPNVFGSIFRFDGQASVFDATRGPCYRCLYPEPPEPGAVPSCAEGGVLGVLPGIIGMIQATEAIKIATGIGEPLIGRLLLYDALAMRFHELTIKKNPRCALCGEHPSQHELIDYLEFCGVPHAANATMEEDEIDIATLQRLRTSGVTINLLDVREEFESRICSLGGELIPLRELPARLESLPWNFGEEIIVYCKMGGRSAEAVKLLRAAGYVQARNLRGGIDAWRATVDPTMAQY